MYTDFFYFNLHRCCEDTRLLAGIGYIPTSTNVESWHSSILPVMFLTMGDDLTSFILNV